MNRSEYLEALQRLANNTIDQQTLDEMDEYEDRWQIPELPQETKITGLLLKECAEGERKKWEK